MSTIGLIIVAAAMALGLSMRTRVPASVLAIVLGLGLQALSAPFDPVVVRDGLLMAATFLVFAVGAELERSVLVPYLRASLGLAVMMFVITAAVGLLMWIGLDLDIWTATYWVLALAASSTLLVLDLLGKRERLFEPIGHVVSATVLIQDLAVIVALSVFAALTHETLDALLALAGVVALATAAWVLARWIAPFIMLRLDLDEEERLLFVLLVLFCFAAVARWTGGVVVTGAYFAGMAISRFPVGDLARGYLKSFSDFFATIFYVLLGVVVTLPSPSEVIAEILFVVAVLLIRPLLLLPLVRRTGLALRSSIEAVTLLAQAGELAVIVAIIGIELGHIDDDTLGMIAAVIAITTAIAPWLSSDQTTWRLTQWYPLGRPVSLEKTPTNHVLLLGCGETGSALLPRLREAGTEVVVVDDDPHVVESLRQQGIAALRGDGADPDILREAGAERARAIVSTMRRSDDNATLLSMAHGPLVLVRVFSEKEAEHIRELGGHPIIEAELAADALLRWHAQVSAMKGCKG